MAGIAEVTSGLMAKKVIVTVGELKGEDVDSYLNLTSKGGTCVVTAIGSLVETNVKLNLAMLTLMQKNLQGTIFGGGNPHYDIPQLLSMYKAGKLNLDDMVTRQYKLEQINDGYKDMLRGPQHPRRHPLHRRGPLDHVAHETPPRRRRCVAASESSWRCVQAGDKDGWLALMADDVVIEDPIGQAVTNPDGNGVRGKEAVGGVLRRQHRPQPADRHPRGDVPVEFPDGDRLHPGAAHPLPERLHRHGAGRVHLQGRTTTA